MMCLLWQPPPITRRTPNHVQGLSSKAGSRSLPELLRARCKSDGTLLTAADRRANGLADTLAKAAAEGQRMREDARARLKEEAEQVTQMAIWLARVTVQANRFPVAPGKLRGAPWLALGSLPPAAALSGGDLPSRPGTSGRRPWAPQRRRSGSSSSRGLPRSASGSSRGPPQRRSSAQLNSGRGHDSSAWGAAALFVVAVVWKKCLVGGWCVCVLVCV